MCGRLHAFNAITQKRPIAVCCFRVKLANEFANVNGMRERNKIRGQNKWPSISGSNSFDDSVHLPAAGIFYFFRFYWTFGIVVATKICNKNKNCCVNDV